MAFITNNRFAWRAGKRSPRGMARIARPLIPDTVRGMDTQLVSGPNDPVPTSADIIVTHKFTLRVVTAADGQFILSIPSLLSAIPGGNTVFDRIRLIKISCFGPATADGFVRFRQVTGGVTPYRIDAADFIDYGVQGARRPCLHIRPSFSVRNDWVATANSPGEIASIISLPDTPVIIQMAVQLRTIPQTNSG